MKSIVITTIQQPTEAMRAYEMYAPEARLIVVGDLKTPAAFDGLAAQYLSVEDQMHLDFELPAALPYNHYARKNLGYLVAMRDGSEAIAETDDDNAPTGWDLSAVDRSVLGLELWGPRWLNVYRWFTKEHIWPRGFPLERVKGSFTEAVHEAEAERWCPIQQFLADGDPDVDAVYRMTVGRTDHTFFGSSVILGVGSFAPFNSQSTVWWPEAFPYLYLPSYTSFRMTDIWRSFVAQVCLWAHGWQLAYHSSAVRQKRNDHDLKRDFLDELPGYLHNLAIADALAALKLSADPYDAGANLVACYRLLVARGWVGADEMPLVEAWVRDVIVATR